MSETRKKIEKPTQNHESKQSGNNQFFGIQAKFNIGDSNDKYEKEADAAADEIVGNGAASESGETFVGNGITPLVQKKDSEFGTSVAMESGDALERSLNASKGKGSQMDDDTQNSMESGFGEDFGDVKIHTDENAVQMNREIGSRAFTHGNDIYFDQGEYNPSAKEGKHLLAHELAHTIQQKRGAQQSIQRKTGWKDIPKLKRLKAGPKKVTSTRIMYTNYVAHKVKQRLARANISVSINFEQIYKTNPKNNKREKVYTLTVTTTDFTKDATKDAFSKLLPDGKDAFFIDGTHSKELAQLIAIVKADQKSRKKRFSDLQIHNLLQSGRDPKECIGTFNLGIQNLYGNKTIEKGDLGKTSIKSLEKLQKKKLASTPIRISATYSGTKIPIDYENPAELGLVTMDSTSAAIKKELDALGDGTYVYLASLANGYHSVVLVINKNGGKYEFVWKDQFGFKPFTESELDHKILRAQGGVSHNDLKNQYSANEGVRYKHSEDIPAGPARDKAAAMALATTKMNIKENLFSRLVRT